MEGKYLEALYGWAFTSLLSPQDPEAHFHAAECLLSLGQKQEALKALHMSLSRAQENSPLRNQIVVLKETLAHG